MRSLFVLLLVLFSIEVSSICASTQSIKQTSNKVEYVGDWIDTWKQALLNLDKKVVLEETFYFKEKKINIKLNGNLIQFFNPEDPFFSSAQIPFAELTCSKKVAHLVRADEFAKTNGLSGRESVELVSTVLKDLGIKNGKFFNTACQYGCKKESLLCSEPLIFLLDDYGFLVWGKGYSEFLGAKPIAPCLLRACTRFERSLLIQHLMREYSTFSSSHQGAQVKYNFLDKCIEVFNLNQQATLGELAQLLHQRKDEDKMIHSLWHEFVNEFICLGHSLLFPIASELLDRNSDPLSDEFKFAVSETLLIQTDDLFGLYSGEKEIDFSDLDNYYQNPAAWWKKLILSGYEELNAPSTSIIDHHVRRYCQLSTMSKEEFFNRFSHSILLQLTPPLQSEKRMKHLIKYAHDFFKTRSLSNEALSKFLEEKRMNQDSLQPGELILLYEVVRHCLNNLDAYTFTLHSEHERTKVPQSTE